MADAFPNPTFPREIEQLIIESLPPNSKKVLLACTLVCKAWVPFMRLQLLSLYFPDGRVTIEPSGTEIDTLLSVFQSPLRTFDPGFIKILRLNENFENPNLGLDYDIDPFLDAFPKIDRIPLSLEGLEFNEVDLDPGADREWIRLASPPIAALSTVKRFTFRSPGGETSFKYVVQLVSLLPAVKHIVIQSHSTMWTEWQPREVQIWCPAIRRLQPARTLRKLEFDEELFPAVVTWLMLGATYSRNISSIMIHGCNWNYMAALEWVLKEGGDYIKELHLVDAINARHLFSETGGLPGASPPSPGLTVHNRALRRFRITGSFDLMLAALPYFFDIERNFAPKLELLELRMRRWDKKELEFIEKLAFLDEQIISRPLLKRVVIIDSSCDVGGLEQLDVEWGVVESQLRGLLSRCEAKGIVQFIRRPLP